MALADDNYALSHDSLLHREDDHDILHEFLDQRIFDSINAGIQEQNQSYENPVDYDAFGGDSLYKLGYEDNTVTNGNKNNILEFENTSNENSLPKEEDFGSQPKEEDSGFQPKEETSPHPAFFSLNPSPKNSIVDGDFAYKSLSLDGHDAVREEFSKVKFGNNSMKICPDTIEITDPSVLDFSEETMSKLPYDLDLLNLPSYSRVETQIKLRFKFTPAPKESLIHIPQDLMSKSKFCLEDPVDTLPSILKENMLYMDTYVMTSNLKTSCNICSRCVKREQKRALRSKTGANEADSPTNSISGSSKHPTNPWPDENMVKKAIFFNCKEIVSFPPPTGLINDRYKTLDFSARIICYCRHHLELDGFKLLFVARDFTGQIVAKHVTQPIRIMDRKKTSTSAVKEGQFAPLHAQDHDTRLQQSSPNSVDDSTSEALANTDTNNDSAHNMSRGYKRKKLSFDDSYNSSTNPMFSGSGFSPVSNSDTNASIHNFNPKNGMGGNIGGTYLPGVAPALIPRQRLLQQLQMVSRYEQQPAIQKIIPAQGPVRGGIEVTLLGFNFRPGLIVKFGSKTALATHCWSESTIVTYLPPALLPGQVLVSFEGHDHVMMGSQQLIFTYTDDTDRQLIELALQIVGLKMNGKLEDAKNIAKRIVGSDNSDKSPDALVGKSPEVKTEQMEWYDNAHRAVEKLYKSDLSTEEILINFLSLVDLPNCPIIIPNWQLSNGQGQSLLHLATLKQYSKLVGFLITHGCKVDLKDNQGLTPLFVASMCGYRDLINVFIDCKANWSLKLSNERMLKDYSDLNVLDVFSKLENDAWAASEETSSSHGSASDTAEDPMNRSHSVDSLNSLYAMSYGKHISRMNRDADIPVITKLRYISGNSDGKAYSSIAPSGNESSDFADSELDTEDEFSDLGDRNRKGAWKNEVNEADYLDEFGEESELSETDEPAETGGTRRREKESPVGLWQKVKTAVFSNDGETELPTYDDLFPFGSHGFSKPKTQLERELNEDAKLSTSFKEGRSHDEVEIGSDSSEDMVISYINHPRKTVENDKMLLFFWLPVLFMILGLFAYMNITGYKVETIERLKEYGRDTIGNIVVGNERLSKVFSKGASAQLAL